MEWSSGELVVVLKGEQMVLEVGDGGEVIGSEDLALDDGEIDLDLVEPAGMNGSVNQYDRGPRGAQAVSGFEPAVGGTVVGNPDLNPWRFSRRERAGNVFWGFLSLKSSRTAFLSHHQFGQAGLRPSRRARDFCKSETRSHRRCLPIVLPAVNVVLSCEIKGINGRSRSANARPD